MISRALGYRKSYCRHWSSDVDYASAALEVLRDAAPASPILALDESVNRLVNAFRVLDCLPNTSAIDNENSILSVHQATVALNACARMLPAPPPEKQTIFQDNRYEQHVHPW
jgi:hypothetical protein